MWKSSSIHPFTFYTNEAPLARNYTPAWRNLFLSRHTSGVKFFQMLRLFRALSPSPEKEASCNFANFTTCLPGRLPVCVCVCFSKSKATFSLPSQDRLTRCTMHCNDKAKDLFDSGAKEPAVRSLMERCVGSCVDDHINLIPSMTRRLKENLDSIEQWGAGLSWRAWAHHAHTVHTAAQG